MENLEKAKKILSEMIDYINLNLEPYARKEDFKKKRLFFVERRRISSFRGYCDLYFYLDPAKSRYEYFYVGGYCEDGNFVDYNITKEKSRYSYNEEDYQTIEIALLMAKNWSLIKSEIEKSINEYKKQREETNNLLDNFKI